MEEYPQILLLFYRKVVSPHPQKSSLIRKLHSLIKKCEVVDHDKEPHTLPSKSRRDNEHSSPCKRAQLDSSILKREEQEWGLQCTFISHSFQQNLLYAVLNRFIQTEDFLGFKCLEEKLNILLEESSLEEGIMRIISYEWFRVGQIMLNKNKLRWEKLFSQSIHNFPLEFDDLFVKIFEGAGRYKDKNQQILAQISALLKVKIIYYEIEGRRMLKCSNYGIGNSEIHVCFLHDLSKYIICSKPPHQSQAGKLKQKALDELRLGFASLLEQYEEGTINMASLSNLSGVKFNEWKVMTYLGKR